MGPFTSFPPALIERVKVSPEEFLARWANTFGTSWAAKTTAVRKGVCDQLSFNEALWACVHNGSMEIKRQGYTDLRGGSMKRRTAAMYRMTK